MVMRKSRGWKTFTWTDAVAAMRLMVGSSGQDPAHYALHSERIGGATQLAVRGVPELQIQRAGRWKSRVFDVCAGDRGSGIIVLRGTRENRVECFHGLVVRGTVSFMARLALWCEILLSPAGEGAGHKLRVSLSHKTFVGGFIVRKLTRISRRVQELVLAGLTQHWQAFFSTTASVPRLP